MENKQVKKNDLEQVLNEVNGYFLNATDSIFFVVQYTDKFDIGIWNENIIENTNKLLELRIFKKILAIDYKEKMIIKKKAWTTLMKFNFLTLIQKGHQRIQGKYIPQQEEDITFPKIYQTWIGQL